MIPKKLSRKIPRTNFTPKGEGFDTFAFSYKRIAKSPPLW